MTQDLVDKLNELLKINTRLAVHVKPNAKKTELIAFDPITQTLKAAIKAPPENGKANAELERFLSKLTKKSVVVIAGKTSKRKIVAFS